MFNKTNSLILLILVFGIFFRLYHIEFGLPHSFHSDEPEIVELAIKYTYEFRDIVLNNNYHKLKPISFIYGTFPTYVLTIATMGFSKFLNIINIDFDRTTIYIYLRSFVSLLSFLIVPITAFLYFKFFKDKVGALWVAFFVALNWKLIVHAHYVNADIVLTLLVSILFLFIYYYWLGIKPKLFLVLAAVVFGLAVGTKITALLSVLPLAYLFFKKKDFYGFVGFGLISFQAYFLSNPFSIIFFDDFLERMLLLRVFENGLVFDSSDQNPFKYLIAFAYISTPIVFGLGIFGVCKLIKLKNDFYIFLMLNILVYFIFFTLGERRVDRWLLPVLPVFFIFSAYGLVQVRSTAIKTLTFISYLALPILLLFQFGRWTPKSEAYLWMDKNISPLATKYVVTEEGLDPMNKLPLANVLQFQVYGYKDAQLSLPPDPTIFNYVVLSSKPMNYYKNPIVKKTYPDYYNSWLNFENTVKDSTKFELVKSFVLPKPNLINLSDTYIYKNKNL